MAICSHFRFSATKRGLSVAEIGFLQLSATSLLCFVANFRIFPLSATKKRSQCGNSLFRLCRRQGCVRDSRFRRAASVLDVPFAAELAILAACASKITQTVLAIRFANRGVFVLRLSRSAQSESCPHPVCYGEPENVRLQAFAFSAKITALAFSHKTYFFEGLPSNIRSLTLKIL